MQQYTNTINASKLVNSLVQLARKGTIKERETVKRAVLEANPDLSVGAMDRFLGGATISFDGEDVVIDLDAPIAQSEKLDKRTKAYRDSLLADTKDVPTNVHQMIEPKPKKKAA